ncbi:MAG: phosphatidic acid phosphatase [Clostridia bacterium]|nr:phosphatidic acid phosphatase [Clostridia bacterium]
MEKYDYRGFRLNKLTNPEYKHILLLLYWPFYGLMFLILERFVHIEHHVITSPLDKYVPFCEYFVIPYYFWFVFMFWIMVYSFFYDVDAFKKFSWFVIITYTIALLTYIIYPNEQQLRPDSFERSNIFTYITSLLYFSDTNTDVCPSVHIIGSLATMFTAWHSKRYGTALWRISFFVMTVIICASTLFLKQHSFTDVFAGIIVSIVVYPFIYLRKKNKTDNTHTEEKEKILKT